MKTVVNVAELAARDWNFVEDIYDSAPVNWAYFSASPRFAVERIVTRPKLGRYRACLQSTLKLQHPDDVVISHLPRTTHWQSRFMKWSGRSHRHLAFSFNFTDLPNAALRRAMTKSFARVESFVVYSSFERRLYSETFEIPMDKLKMRHWAASIPECRPFSHEALKESYFCAVGGEGRDYGTLIDAFRRLPHQRLVIVTRPHALEDRTLPSNVSVLFNLESAHFWEVVRGSEAVIVPLRDEQTACGHITLVGAMALGKSVISTFSEGTTDYVFPGQSGLTTEARDVEGMKQAVERFIAETTARKEYEEFNRRFAMEKCSAMHWQKLVGQFVVGDRISEMPEHLC